MPACGISATPRATLRRNPGFTTVVVLSMALGIGANTAVFSLLNAVVLKTLPVTNPEELVILEARVKGPGGERTALDWHGDYRNFQDQCRAVHRAVRDVLHVSRHDAGRPGRTGLGRPGVRATTIQCSAVSSRFIGRLLDREDDDEQGCRVP